jgi:hypothetical protein
VEAVDHRAELAVRVEGPWARALALSEGTEGVGDHGSTRRALVALEQAIDRVEVEVRREGRELVLRVLEGDRAEEDGGLLEAVGLVVHARPPILHLRQIGAVRRHARKSLE